MGWEPSKQLLKVTLHEATHLTCSLELSLQLQMELETCMVSLKTALPYCNSG